jgi:hypothetical protein
VPVKLSQRFVRQYLLLTPALQQKVKKTLRLLDADFRYPGLHSHTIQGVRGIFEAYVDQKYRVTFERRGDLLVMRNVDNHDECLKNP